MKRLLFAILMIIPLSISCTVPHEYLVTERNGALVITGTRKNMFGKDEPYLPAGKYVGKVDPTGAKELSVDTKAEPLKLIGDLNVSKLGGN